MGTALYWHDDCLGHVTPDGHPERVARLEHIRAALADMTVLKRIDYDPERTIVATIGLLYILQQVTLMTYGPDARPVEAPFNTRIAIPWHWRRWYRATPSPPCISCPPCWTCSLPRPPRGG